MPIDRGIIDQQLQALGEGSRWWDYREMRDLPAVLHADERILAIAHGKIARGRWLRRSWLIVVTEGRLLLLHSAGRIGWRQLEVAAGQIARVTLRVGPFHGRLLVTVDRRKYRLLVARPDAYKLLHALSGLRTPSKETFSAFAPTRMARRVIDHVLALPAVALSPDAAPDSRPPPAADTAIQRRVETLEEEAEELRRQVAFLEQLLRQRQTGPVARATANSPVLP